MTEKYKTKTAFALDAIRSAIVRGEIQPGERIVVSRLTEKLGMSATPIREALRILDSEGLITLEPHHGVTVNDLSEEEADEIWKMRALLESEATKLAVPNLTDNELENLEALENVMQTAFSQKDNERLMDENANWHFTIYYASGTKYLIEFIEKLWALFPWETIYLLPSRTKLSFEQHAGIRRALVARDEQLARDLMENHILSGRQAVIDHLRSQNSK